MTAAVPSYPPFEDDSWRPSRDFFGGPPPVDMTDPGHKEIPLGASGLVALVDAEDFDRVVAAGPWIVDYNRGNAYARLSRSRRATRMHSLITGWPITDHINGDGLDNRRANLRQASVQENNRNKRRYANNTSGFKGVALRRESGRWRAYINCDGRRTNLGTFSSPIEAALAYDSAAVEAFGPFARLNFPREVEPMTSPTDIPDDIPTGDVPPEVVFTAGGAIAAPKQARRYASGGVIPGPRDGYCTCNGEAASGRMRDCGIAEHRAEAWAARETPPAYVIPASQMTTLKPLLDKLGPGAGAMVEREMDRARAFEVIARAAIAFIDAGVIDDDAERALADAVAENRAAIA